jgi:predicted nucleotidyltransferase
MMALMEQDVSKLVEPSAALQAEALQVLRAREHELRAKGVAGLALFGSIARGEAGSASDVDLVLELDESAALGLLDLVDLKESLAEELGRPVDIAFQSRLRPWFAARIAPDLVRVF